MCGWGLTSSPPPRGNSPGPIWSRKTNGPTIRRRAAGRVRCIWKPSPRSLLRGTISVSRFSSGPNADQSRGSQVMPASCARARCLSARVLLAYDVAMVSIAAHDEWRRRPQMTSRIPRVTLEQWAVLQAVVEEGSFARAAEALNKSQSAVSYALKDMQQQLPVEVLTLKGRKAELTEAARLLLRRASALLEE